MKLGNNFTYLGSSVSSTEIDVNIRQVKALTAIDWLSIIWKSGARGVMVIVTGYGHGDTSSIPEQDWLHFT